MTRCSRPRAWLVWTFPCENGPAGRSPQKRVGGQAPSCSPGACKQVWPAELLGQVQLFSRSQAMPFKANRRWDGARGAAGSTLDSGPEPHSSPGPPGPELQSEMHTCRSSVPPTPSGCFLFMGDEPRPVHFLKATAPGSAVSPACGGACFQPVEQGPLTTCFQVFVFFRKASFIPTLILDTQSVLFPETAASTGGCDCDPWTVTSVRAAGLWVQRAAD